MVVTVSRSLNCSTVQNSSVQYSTVQYSTVQYSTVQYSTVQYSAVQCSAVQYSAVQYSTVQYPCPAPCSMVPVSPCLTLSLQSTARGRFLTLVSGRCWVSGLGAAWAVSSTVPVIRDTISSVVMSASSFSPNLEDQYLSQCRPPI